MKGKTVEDQMASSVTCYIKCGGVVAVVVLLSLTFAGFGGFVGFSSSAIFTSIVLILSTCLLPLITKQKPPVLVEKSVTEGEEEDDHEELITSPSHSIEDFVPTQQPESKTLTHHKEEHDQPLHDFTIRPSSSPDLHLLSSESESILDHDDHLSTSEEEEEEEDSEVDWPFRDNILYQSPDCSDDGSISDEESLIEIALPSGHFVDHNNELEDQDHQPNKFQLIQAQKVPADNFLPHHHHQSILKQHSLMELLAELNDISEEDNLIEIDISMGSIKCSRFEIEA